MAVCCSSIIFLHNNTTCIHMVTHELHVWRSVYMDHASAGLGVNIPTAGKHGEMGDWTGDAARALCCIGSGVLAAVACMRRSGQCKGPDSGWSPGCGARVAGADTHGCCSEIPCCLLRAQVCLLWMIREDVSLCALLSCSASLHVISMALPYSPSYRLICSDFEYVWRLLGLVSCNK